MKLKMKEDQSMDTLPLFRMGNKIPMERVTETKFGAEKKGWTIQGLPHLGIHKQPTNPGVLKEGPSESAPPEDLYHNQLPNTDTICVCQQDFADMTLI